MVQRLASRLGVDGPAPRLAGMALAFTTGGIEGTVGAVAVDAADRGFIGSQFLGGGGGGNGLTVQAGAEAV